MIASKSKNQLTARIFNPIGEVKGAGNSNEVMSYSFIDKAPLSKTNYYRLKQIDTDGTYTYSKVQEVKRQLNINLVGSNIYPSIWNSGVSPKVQIADVEVKEIQVILFDLHGNNHLQTSLSSHNSPGMFKIENTSSLIPGIYIASIITQEFSVSQQIIVQ